MAKKKAVVETTEAEAVEPEEAAPGGDVETYHILYTPLWRSQLDLGTVESTPAGIQKIVAGAIHYLVVKQVPADQELPHPALIWQQESESVWIATGDDGTGETTLPLVRLTKVG